MPIISITTFHLELLNHVLDSSLERLGFLLLGCYWIGVLPEFLRLDFRDLTQRVAARSMTRTPRTSTILPNAERMELRSSSELSGLGFASASRPGRQQSCSRSAPLASVLPQLRSTT